MAVVLISGASSGFGLLTAKTLALAGHRVFAGVRVGAGRPPLDANPLHRWAADGGYPLQVVPLDVTDAASVNIAVDAVLAQAGRLDVLVNNAGVAAAGLLEAFSVDTVARLFDVNVYGPLRLMRAALPHFRAAGGGLVIQLSSTDGREIMPFLGPYNATKFALEALSDAYRYEVSSFGVEITLLQPGTFPTTAILANCVLPDDAARADAYGALADAPGQLFRGLGEMIAAGAAPDPQRVADTVRGVIEALPGTRPRRIVVDPSGFDGAARINRVADEVQADLLARFGLSHLDAQPTGAAGEAS
jgi:NAD(P)-dependent dehydrogenase (short-subunit alcohol dehydrogenase family)